MQAHRTAEKAYEIGHAKGHRFCRAGQHSLTIRIGTSRSVAPRTTAVLKVRPTVFIFKIRHWRAASASANLPSVDVGEGPEETRNKMTQSFSGTMRVLAVAAAALSLAMSAWAQPTQASSQYLAHPRSVRLS
jgi:hypothetical protein